MDQVDDSRKGERTAGLAPPDAADDAPQQAIDRIAKLAASLFDAPMASIVTVAGGHVESRSAIGSDQAENLAKTVSCAQVLESGRPLVVADERHHEAPSIGTPLPFRFFAGAPLMTCEGQPFGALYIADNHPRPDLTANEIDDLQAFAALAADQLERRPASPSSRQLPPTISAVIAAMSHDIRTPMNGVLGMSELLLAADDLDDRHRRRVEIIRRSGEQLLSIIDQIIDLSRIEADEGRLQTLPFNLRDLVGETLDQVRTRNAGCMIEADFTADNTHALGDAQRLGKVLYCFLDGALGFSPEKTIRTTVETKSCGFGNLRVRLEIKNPGIDVDAIDCLLTAFDQGDPLPSGGFGRAHLALVNCKTLGLILDGEVGVDRPHGQCPILWLEVHLTQQPRQAASELPSSSATIDVRGDPKSVRDVLVAEDNPDMALLIEDLLDEAGYNTTVAPDGASVLKILGEQHVDIVLMDGRMPDMSGFETTHLIRQLPDERAHIPIIALTAEALTGDRERYLSAGMDDYVTKPIEYDALIGAIERCGGLRKCRAVPAGHPTS